MRRSVLLLVLVALGLSAVAAAPGALKLQWSFVGCLDKTWCQYGWYSSPYIGDVDKDGSTDIIASAYSIYCLNGDGTIKWRTRSGHDTTEDYNSVSDVGRTWPSIVVADLDKDKKLDIVTGHGGGVVAVYDPKGKFKSGWPQKLTTAAFNGGEVRSLTVGDLDGDGKLEIVAGSAAGNAINLWVFQHDGKIRAQFPQRQSNTKGYTWGIYNDNIGIFNMFANGKKKNEIVAPSDVHYIMAYDASAGVIPTNSVYKGKTWGEVGFYTNPADELQGWGDCSSGAGTTRANFAKGTVVFTDADKNGTPEIFAVGNVYDCSKDGTYLYYGPFVVNQDRSRWKTSKYDWTNPVINTGTNLVPDGSYNIIEDSQPYIVSADIDGDGVREMLFPSYAGTMKVYWMDKTQKYNWAKLSLGNEYPTEPIVVDFGNDGKAEIIFATWPEKASQGTGHLYIVDYQGNVLQKVPLPAPNPAGNTKYNGALAAPTIGNIDKDKNLEIVLQTISTGIIAYEIPNSAGTRIIWGTGRLNYNRNPDEFTQAKKSCNKCKNKCKKKSKCGKNKECIKACKTKCNNNRKCY